MASKSKRTFLAGRTSSFRPSPIQQLSLLAQACNAINLAEGFPDFPAPSQIKQAAIDAIIQDLNQYRHVEGVCEMVAHAFTASQQVTIDPSNVTICCGQSEAMAASVLAVIDEGDEVLLLDPAYETYEACIILAGGTPVYVALDPPFWTLNSKNIEQAINSRTKAIIINSPHNPTGKVFSKKELGEIAELCCKHDLLAITDEVYEKIIFESLTHISLASFPEMSERTIVTSSLSKTYSVTGWRIGWAIAPPELSPAIKNIHAKLTDSAPAPFQEAALVALQSSKDFYHTLRKEYEERRDLVCAMLVEAGFGVNLKPQGSFFVLAKLPASFSGNDVDYVTQLIEKVGIAFVPGCGFFHTNHSNNNKRSGEALECCNGNDSCRHRYVRVAFCKGMDTLKIVADLMRKHIVLSQDCLTSTLRVTAKQDSN